MHPPSKQQILDNLEARGHRVYKWCNRVKVSRRLFYYVIEGKRGGTKAELIWSELRKDGVID